MIGYNECSCVISYVKSSQENLISMMMICLNFLWGKKLTLLTNYYACIIYLLIQRYYLSDYYLINLKDNIVRKIP